MRVGVSAQTTLDQGSGRERTVALTQGAAGVVQDGPSVILVGCSPASHTGA